MASSSCSLACWTCDSSEAWRRSPELCLIPRIPQLARVKEQWSTQTKGKIPSWHQWLSGFLGPGSTDRFINCRGSPPFGAAYPTSRSSSGPCASSNLTLQVGPVCSTRLVLLPFFHLVGAERQVRVVPPRAQKPDAICVPASNFQRKVNSCGVMPVCNRE